MHYARYLLLLSTCSPLLTLAQTSPVTAIRQANTEYIEILARLIDVRSDCVRNEIYPQRCETVFVPNPQPEPSPLNPPQSQANVANDITQANDQLDIAAKTFVPKVPCATIAAAFGRVRILPLRLSSNPLATFPLVTYNKTTKDGNITEINSRLRDIACSTAPATQVAAKANAEAFRRAISDQIVKVDLIGAIFARNKACNNPQRPAQLQRFANAVAAVDADDKKTAQAFTLLRGTLGCIL
ncbi:MAG: hypothetical protein L6R36_005582 [Xanthoria steineri]|nr:MAG: hypothetical protein L6R36_005582 [Xanthoria steineri]